MSDLKIGIDTTNVPSPVNADVLPIARESGGQFYWDHIAWSDLKVAILGGVDISTLKNNFDSHIADPSAHHTRYTDAEAVNAIKTDADWHTHSNKDVLDLITSQKLTNWDTAYTNSHIHSNKANLDIINQNLNKTANVDFNNIAAAGNVTITGDLTVNGTQFITNTETVEIADNLAIINSGETGDGITAGFAGWEADRGTLTNYRWGFDEPTDLWKIGEVGNLQAVCTRPDSPTDDYMALWDGSNDRLKFLARSSINVGDFNDDGTYSLSGHTHSQLHSHSNKSVLDSISSAGSGSIITSTERSNYNSAYSHISNTSNPHNNTLQQVTSQGNITDYRLFSTGDSGIPDSGVGIIMFWNTTALAGYLSSYDYTAETFEKLSIKGDPIELGEGNVNITDGILQVDGVGNSYVMGNFGIKTNSPDQDLTIVDSTAAIHLDGNDAIMLIDKALVSNKAAVNFQLDGVNQWIVGTSDSGDAGDGDEFFIGQNIGGANADFWMEPDGSIGFGTINPGAPVHISANTDDLGATAAWIILQDEDTTAGSRNPSIEWLDSSDNSMGKLYIQDSGNDGFNFINNSGDWLGRWANSGMLAINKQSPSYTLDVNGDIYGEKFIVNKNIIFNESSQSTSGNITFNLSASSVFELTMTGDVTLDYSNPNTGTFIIILKQDATGGRTVSWASSKWQTNGGNVSVNSAANGYTVLSCFYNDMNSRMIVTELNDLSDL